MAMDDIDEFTCTFGDFGRLDSDAREDLKEEEGPPGEAEWMEKPQQEKQSSKPRKSWASLLSTENSGSEPQEKCLDPLAGVENKEDTEHVMGLLGTGPDSAASARQVDMLHRGLVNLGNDCFRNVVLQALLSCKVFTSLLLRASPLLAEDVWRQCLPTWGALAAFVAEFQTPILGMSQARNGSKKLGFDALKPGKYMGPMFSSFRSSNSQEDSHEFLSYLLDTLHEEVVAAKVSTGWIDPGSSKGGKEGGEESGNGAEGDDQNGWAEVCKGRSNVVLNKAGIGSGDSLIRGLFYGTLRSEVRRGSGSAMSVTLDRFDCLQLDLQTGSGVKIDKLEDSLKGYFSGQSIDGVKGKANMNIKASKSFRIHSLPHVLTLLLKQFYFDPELGPRKRGKLMSYSLELTIPDELLSKELIISGRKFRYRLITVILHHGKNIHGGHYTAYCIDALNKWRHYDDTIVSEVSEAKVLKPPYGDPYILCYELRPQESAAR